MSHFALSLYRSFSRNSEGWATRKLAKRLAEGKEDPDRIAERRGEASSARPKGELIWFHAASVGEALSILELISRLGEEDTVLNFLVTTGTVTSAEILSTRLPDRTVHQYIPLDVLPFVTRFLDHWTPDLAVWTESEFWPTLMSETHARGTPMILLNGRMSRKSFQNWKWMKGSARELLSQFAAAHVQDAQTADYLSTLGMPAHRITVTGTLKEGSAALPCDEDERTALVGLIGSRPVWLVASTHPGEETIAAKVHREVSRRSPRMLLIMAPRHPERGDELAEFLRKDGWRLAQRSKNEDPGPDTQIYLADTLGEMGLWYRIAPVSFVGGSLVEIGGHNPFEPAALGSAILYGPHVDNFRDIYARLAAAGGARLVATPTSLEQAVAELASPDRAAQMAHAAWEVCSSGAGVTDKALELLMDQIESGL
ncbi:MAG: glycosyltransferase N-terminal domain-containing protein [Pseudomonadota bacterium]